MENLTKDKLAELIMSYYAKGVSYNETMNYIKQLFLLSREDRIWCKDVWRGCINNGEINE